MSVDVQSKTSVNTSNLSGSNRTLLQKLEGFSDFPQFWEEGEDGLDPNIKAVHDKEVEEFRAKLEEQNKQMNSSKLQVHSYAKLRALCLDKSSQFHSKKNISSDSADSS